METIGPVPAVVLSTVADAETADRLAEALVSERLAGCVNIVPGVRSIYVWEGELQRDAELLLVIKTSDHRLEALVARIQQLHPYSCPEVLALAVGGGSSAYLEWLAGAVR